MFRRILQIATCAGLLAGASLLSAQDFEVLKVQREVGLREKAGFIYKEVGRLKAGEEVIVDAREGDWLHVAHMGWIPAEAAGIKPGLGPYEVTVPSARLRKGPGTDFPVAGVERQGSVLAPVEEKDGWFRLQNGSWVFGELVRKVKAPAPALPSSPSAGPGPAPAPEERIVRILPPTVNRRSGPSTDTEIVGTSSAGESLHVTDERDGWVRVREGGWIRGDLVTDAAKAASSGARKDLRQWGLLSLLGVYIKVVEVPPQSAIATRIKEDLDRLTGEERGYTFLSILVEVPPGTAYRFNFSPAYNRVQVTDAAGRRFGNFVHKEGDLNRLPPEVRMLFQPAAVFPGSVHTGLLAFSGELDPARISKVEIYMSGHMQSLYEE